jgi:hypothetical protein
VDDAPTQRRQAGIDAQYGQTRLFLRLCGQSLSALIARYLWYVFSARLSRKSECKMRIDIDAVYPFSRVFE